MSKTQLKKELANLEADQLRQLILDLYSRNKGAKAYFDFFVDPDLEKLTEKYRAAIDKEMLRSKYNKSTARISRVRTSIREYESFGIDAENVLDLMVYALKTALNVERSKYVKSSFISGVNKLAQDILKFGDKNAVFDTAFKLLEEALGGSYGYIGFVNQIRRELQWSLIDPRKQ